MTYVRRYKMSERCKQDRASDPQFSQSEPQKNRSEKFGRAKNLTSNIWSLRVETTTEKSFIFRFFISVVHPSVLLLLPPLPPPLPPPPPKKKEVVERHLGATPTDTACVLTGEDDDDDDDDEEEEEEEEAAHTSISTVELLAITLESSTLCLMELVDEKKKKKMGS